MKKYNCVLIEIWGFCLRCFVKKRSKTYITENLTFIVKILHLKFTIFAWIYALKWKQYFFHFKIYHGRKLLECHSVWFDLICKQGLMYIISEFKFRWTADFRQNDHINLWIDASVFKIWLLIYRNYYCLVKRMSILTETLNCEFLNWQKARVEMTFS